MKLWLDVDDLFFFAKHSARPTGIQRLTGEIYRALATKGTAQIGFLVHDDVPDGFRAVDWQTVLATYESLTGGARAAPPASSGARRDDPPIVQPRTFGSVLRRIFLEDGQPQQGSQTLSGSTTDDPPATVPSIPRNRADVLCSLGAPWHDARYADRVMRFIEPSGMRFAMLVHDLIPLLCPEFFEHGRAPNFAPFMRDVLPLVDVLLTNSQSTARDVVRWSIREGVTLKAEPRHLPIGTGFARHPAGALPPGLEPGNFVLFVSTIEIRKNHLQAFRVWNRLLQDMPRDRVPTLVFAGTPGWMVADLLKAIESTNRLDGKLVMIEGPDDATLCALYQACRFTLFLSFYEGWGLPISDSLSFGKVCVAANRTSLPEAGGLACVYVDPDDTTGAYKTIRRMVEDPSVVPELERRLAASFVPVPWSETAEAVLESIFPHHLRSGRVGHADYLVAKT
jgi:glycosyltransferase involved in cell wall biosynthesis